MESGMERERAERDLTHGLSYLTNQTFKYLYIRQSKDPNCFMHQYRYIIKYIIPPSPRTESIKNKAGNLSVFKLSKN